MKTGFSTIREGEELLSKTVTMYEFRCAPEQCQESLKPLQHQESSRGEVSGRVTAGQIFSSQTVLTASSSCNIKVAA